MKYRELSYYDIFTNAKYKKMYRTALKHSKNVRIIEFLNEQDKKGKNEEN